MGLRRCYECREPLDGPSDEFCVSCCGKHNTALILELAETEPVKSAVLHPPGHEPRWLKKEEKRYDGEPEERAR